jgi:RNA polymerase sigma factor (sigma-70 family)
MRQLSEIADQDLLADYASTRSPAVFAQLVERHGPMVLHVALRLLGNWHDAEEVSQAVFLVLAQRAAAVNSSLAGWLHKVARDVSLQMLRAGARRSRREADAVRRNAKPDAASEAQLREELDVALMKLPDRLREAVVLRYLEGRDQEEAARLAGCDKGTLSRRCTRGLSQLATCLTRRGAMVTPAVLTAFLVNQSAASVPAATLTALQCVGAGAASASAAALAKGAINTMFWAKAKLLAAVIGVATVVGAGAVAPLVLSPAPMSKAETVLRLDFEDGMQPTVCTSGQVVPGPARSGNRFCLEGEAIDGVGRGKIFLEKPSGLLTFSDDLVLVFDLWADARVSSVDFHFWNQTQQASQGCQPIRVAREQWVPRVVVRLADFRSGNDSPKAGDLIANLAIQAGQPDGALWIDNLELIRSAELARRLP